MCRKLLPLLLGIATACSTELPHESPFDPETSLERQARGTVMGSVALEGETDFSQVTVELQNDSRTYSVDTQADGSVRLTGVVPGRYELSLRTRYFDPVSEVVEIRLADSYDLGKRILQAKRATVRGVAVLKRLDGTRSLTGGGVTVKLRKVGSIRSGASEAPSLQTAAEPVDEDAAYYAISGSEGDFRITDVPAGVYEVEASGEGVPNAAAGTVSVTGEGEVATEEITLEQLSGYFTIAGATADGPSSNYTNDETVRLSMVHYGALTMRVGSVREGAPLGCDSSGGYVGDTRATVDIVLPAEGLNALCVILEAADGTQSEPLLGSITYDKTAPSMAALQIQGGAPYAATSQVTLTLSAFDATAGVSKVLLSENPAFTGAAPQPFVPVLVTALSGGDGQKTIYAKYIDKVGNASAPVSASVVVDTVSPSLVFGLEDIDGNSLTATNNARLIARLQAVVDSPLEMMISNRSDFAGASWQPYQAYVQWDLLPTALSQGQNRTVYAKLRDAARHLSPTVSAEVWLDTVAPQNVGVTIAPEHVSTATVTVDLSPQDADWVELSAEPGFQTKVRFSPQASTSFTFAGADGTKTVYARFGDLAGNVSAVVADQVVLDTRAPQLASLRIREGSVTHKENIMLFLGAVDADEMQIAEGAACGGDWGKYAEERPFVLSTGDAVKTVSARFRDTAGNTTACLRQTIELDSQEPTFTAGKAIEIAGDAPYSKERTLLVSLHVTGATEVLLSESSTFAGATWQPAVTTVTWNFGGGDGLRTIYFKARDAALNETLPQSDDIQLDTNPPLLHAVTGATAVSAASLTINLSASGAFEMRLSEDAAFEGVAWVAFAPVTTVSLSSGQGAKTLYVQLSDPAGNVSIVRTHTVALDTDAPQDPVLSLTGSVYTKSPVVSLQVISEGASELLLSQWSAMTDVTWQPYASLKTFVLGGTDGEKRIYARTRDAAGNLSAIASAAVTLDTAPPMVSLFRTEDAAGNPISLTNQLRYYVRLNATDTQSPFRVQYSADGVFAGVLEESYQARRGWDVPSPADTDGASYSTHVRLVDAAGNATTLSPLTVHVDNIGPTAPSLSISPALVSSPTVTVTLGAVSAQAVELSADISFLMPSSFAYRATTSYTLSAGDGLKTLYARYVDAAGNYSAIVAASTLLDQTGPENAAFTILQASPTNAEILTLNLGAVGATQMAVSELDCGSDWEPYTQAKAFPLSDTSSVGQRTIAVRFRDAVGITTECLTRNVVFDAEVPEVRSYAINYGALATTSGTVKLSFDVVGATQLQVSEQSTFADAAWVPYSAERTFVLSAGNGTKTVHARFRDDAGNTTERVEDDIILDTTQVGAPFVSIQADATSSTTVQIFFGAANADEIMVSEQTDLSGATWAPYYTVTNYTFTGVDEAKTIYAKFRKLTGEETAIVSDSYILDRAAPSFSQVRINNGAAFTTSNQLTLTLTGVDALSGVGAMQISEDPLFTGEPERAYAPALVFPVSAAPGKKTVWARFRDRAGNYAGAVSAEIVFDDTDPEVAGFQVEDAAGNPLSLFNSARVVVHLVASDDNPLEMMVSNRSDFAGSSWQPYQEYLQWDLPLTTLPNGEPRTVFARVRDAAGRIKSAGSYLLTLDTMEPSNAGIDIVPSATTSPTVSVNLTYANANWVELSSDVGFQSMKRFAAQGTTTYTFTSGDGSKVLYARYSDFAGNYSATVADEVLLDTRPPQLAAFSILQGDLSNLASVNLALTAVDAAEMRISEGGCVAGWNPFASSAVYAFVDSTEEFKTISVQYRDSVGNVTGCLSKGIYYDKTPPTPLGVTIDTGASTTRSTVVQLEIHASDNLAVEEMQLSNTGTFQNTGWEPVTTATTWLLAPVEGLQRVYVRFRDGAGNVSAPIFDEIIVDQTPPTSVTLGFSDGTLTNLGARRLVWEPVNAPDVAGYRITECEGAFGCESVLSTTTVGLVAAWTDAALENDYSRTFYVSTIYSDGATSAPSPRAELAWSSAPAPRSGILFVDDDGGSAKNDRLLADLTSLGYSVDVHPVAPGADGPPLVLLDDYAVVLWSSDDVADPLTSTDEDNLAALTGDRTLLLLTPGYVTQASAHPARSQLLYSTSQGVKTLGGVSTIAGNTSHPAGQGISFRPKYPAGVTTLGYLESVAPNALGLLREGNDAIAATSDWLPRGERGAFVAIPYGHITEVSQSFGLWPEGAWLDAPLSTGLTTDDGKLTFTLPFSFPFYDRYYDQVTVYSNGFISFVPYSGGGITPPGDILSAVEPNAVVAGYWRDLNPAAGGSIMYASSPDAFTVSYDGIQDFNYPVTQSFQITLVSDGRVRLYFRGVTDFGTTTTVGLENETGTNGMLFDLNGNGPFGGMGIEFMSEGSNPQRLILLRNLLRFAMPPNAVHVEPVPYTSVGLDAEGATEMMVSLDGTFDTEAWQAYAATFTVPVGAEGEQVIYVKLRDAAGNETVVVTATVGVDTTPPESASLTIGNGAYTNSQIITLQTNAVGASQMMLSESPVFTGAVAQPWAPTATFVLGTGEGLHAVYARYIDAAGNSTIRSASTTLDLTPPEAPIIETPSYVTTSSLVVVKLANDNPRLNEAIAFDSYEVQGGNYTGWTRVTPVLEGGKPTFLFSLSSDGEYRLSIRARDMAGNSSAADTLTLVRDTVAPEAPSNLVIVEGNGNLNLDWTASSSADVVGYRVYYGAAPNNWAGNFATEGPSPIELGRVLRTKLNGLPNNVRVYVGVAAFDRVGLESVKLEGDGLPNSITPAERLNWVKSDSVYLTADGSLAAYIRLNTIEMWDLSNPYRPVTLSTYTNAGMTFSRAQLDWPTLYVLDTATNRIRYFNVSNPSSLSYLGTYLFPDVPYSLSVTQGRVAVGLETAGWYLFRRNTNGALTYLNSTGFGGRNVVCVPLRCYTADTTLQVFDTQSLASPSLTRLGAMNTEVVADLRVSDNKAFMAIRSGSFGLQVVDVSDPSNMQTIGTALGETDARSLAIEGPYAYLGNEDWGDFKTMRVLDLSDLTRIQQVGVFRWEDGTDGVKSVDIEKTNLYMATNNGVKILSIAEPQLFRELDAFTPPGSWGGPGYRMIIEGTVLMTNAKGLELMDVSNPADLRMIAGDGSIWGREMRHSTTYSMEFGQLRTHSLSPSGTLYPLGTFAGMAGQFDYLYARGPYGFAADGSAGLRVLNVANAGAITSLATCSPDGVGSCTGTFAYAGGILGVHGKWVFMSDQYNFTNGAEATMWAINVANPSAPYPTASTTIAGQTDSLCNDGTRIAYGASLVHLMTWEESTATFVDHAQIDHFGSRDCSIAGDYLYLPGRNGLAVYNIANLAAPQLLATYYLGQTALPTGNLLFLGDRDAGLLSGRIEP